MSIYKICVEKNIRAAAADDDVALADGAEGGADVSVEVVLNNTLVTKQTVTNTDACLYFDADLPAGNNTIVVRPENGAGTDIHVDMVMIDDDIIVASQYLMESRIFGKADDYSHFKTCAPYYAHKGGHMVWWGQVYNADGSAKAAVRRHRPHIISDVGEWWQWDFVKTASGQIHWTHDDSDSPTYDSTENTTYYAAKKPTAALYTDESYASIFNDSTFPVDDSTTPIWSGNGLYNVHDIDSTVNFMLQGADSTANTFDLQYFATDYEWKQARWYASYWHRQNGVEVKTIT
jgi:hypothetical protein